MVKPEQPRNVNPLMLVTLVGMVEAVRRNYARMHTHRSSQPSAETSHLHLPSCLDSQPRRDLIWSRSDCSRSFLNSQFNHEVALAHGLARRQVPQRRRDGSEASHRLVRLGPHTLPADSERQSPSKTAVQRLALARGIALYLFQPPEPLRQLLLWRRLQAAAHSSASASTWARYARSSMGTVRCVHYVQYGRRPSANPR